MSQWAEIRHLFLVERVAKRAIARRLGVDRKTVERALGAERLQRNTSVTGHGARETRAPSTRRTATRGALARHGALGPLREPHRP